MIDLLEGEPQGGLARWSPRLVPPIGVELTPIQALACAFRILAATGFSENVAGHITSVDGPNGEMLVNPWGLWWEEICASDICRVDANGKQISGRWDVTPAIHIHTELHRKRPDARVVVHNHPYYTTLLAAVGVLAEVFHQTGALFDGDMCFIDEYEGEVDEDRKGAELAAEIGDKSVALLANHGVIVTGTTMAEAIYRSASFDRACRLTVDVSTLGRDATTVRPRFRSALKASLIERASDVYWAGAVRQLLRREPDVLE
jgi:ribulose-5-phosphate 4-epimerase/fuculose-1-phosphate aldolase